MLGALLLASCAAAQEPQAHPAGPVRGKIRVAGRELEVDVRATRASREDLIVERQPRAYPDPILVLYPRARRQHYHTDYIQVAFQVMFFSREGEVLEVRELARDATRGVTSAREAHGALLVPRPRFDALPVERGQRIEIGEEIRAIVPEELWEVRTGTGRLWVEVADRSAERGRGLMYRTAISEGEGMLFVYPDSRIVSYYMLDTYLPISLAYVREDRTIARIVAEMEPRSGVGVSSREAIRYVLEAPVGWFERSGVVEGDTLEIPEAIREPRER